MADTQSLVSEAARQLASQRWGRTRVSGLLAELHDRAGELTPEQVAELAAEVEQAHDDKDVN